MTLPDTLSLMLFALFEQLLGELDKHPVVVCEQVLDLCKWQIVCIRRASKSAPYKVIASILRDYSLQLGKVLRIQFKVFYVVSCYLGMLRRGQPTYEFFS